MPCGLVRQGTVLYFVGSFTPITLDTHDVLSVIVLIVFCVDLWLDRCLPRPFLDAGLCLATISIRRMHSSREFC